jgi:dienelactone hydrolase
MLAARVCKGSFIATLVSAMLVAVPTPAPAAPSDLIRTDVTFTGHGGLDLHGTVLAAPGSQGDRPALLLIGGSDWSSRTQLLPEAEAFARRGLVTLIYDKRAAARYQTNYQVHADDAQAAFDTLRHQPQVDADRTGLWGRSEGGWIAPIVASRSADVAYVVTVGAVGMGPARQTAWFWSNFLHHHGVSGSLLRAFPHTFTRFAVGAGMFPEADYDPLPVLERVRQPTLMLWSTDDFVHPPQESAAAMRQALDRGGNRHYTIEFLPDTGPDLHRTNNGGWDRLDEVAQGYPELVTSWIDQLTAGPPQATVDVPPRQDRHTVALPRLTWYESPWTQATAVALFLIAYAAYPFGYAIARRRTRNGPPPVRRPARWLAGTGSAMTVGTPVYFLLIIFTGGRALGPVILGRPAPWLLLQTLTAATVVLAVVTAATWWTQRRQTTTARRLGLSLMLAATAISIPWAGYWGLLLP